MISPESEQYKDRFQLVDDQSSGNISLLISHLTVEDVGDYRCNTESEYRYTRLTVKEAPKRPSPSTTTILTTAEPEKPDSKHIIISCGVVVFLLLRIVGGVIYWKHRGQRREQMGEGQTGQRTQKKQALKSEMAFQHIVSLLTNACCRLEGYRDTQITAYTGDSVLLPCSCTDLHTKPQSFTWKRYFHGRYTYNWVQISPESEQYKDRFQLVNDQSSGNLSLLISHLTVEDGGVYRCSRGSVFRDIKLTVKGCTLNHERVDVTGFVGHSVLLPCSCSELQAKPQTLRWTIYKEFNYKEIFPKDQTNHYTHRVQLFNNHPPGNLSLLISHLTVEDEGDYLCRINNNNYKYIHLTVNATEKILVTKGYTNSQSETSENETPDFSTTIIISCGVVVVLLLLMILGGVMYWKHRGQTREQMSEGQTGQRTQQQKQDLTKSLNSPVTSEPTYEAVHEQTDSAVLYESINLPPKGNKAEEKDDVTYSTVVHGNYLRAAHRPVASEDTTVYASIKTN
ncbi:hypothetical protein C0J50_23257 [Silurus asotus]|uniref:Ig-like domain-containing protein n=1 Tax=Silurus asotus TaxID=30991 RepID=A0AAD5AJP8_SILAS|nr:hypothetical protein C0J50_23257 [Silurus asotus]